MSKIGNLLIEGAENIEPNVNAADGAKILAVVPEISPNDFKNGEVQKTDGIMDKNDDAFDQKLLPYTPKSQALSVGGAFIPINLYGEINAALNKISLEKGDVDEYVRQKLQYATFLDLAEAFKAEQIDAIATIIYNYEKEGSNAVVLADMAGMGKGRICAGIARYAFLQGLVPCFITEKPNLFSDFYRDLNDIEGFPVNNQDGIDHLPIPLIINGGSKENVINVKNKKIKNFLGQNDIVDPRLDYKEGNILVPLFTAQKSSEMSKIFGKRELPKNTQIILSTYSQFSGKGSDSRGQFILRNAENLFVILDESHNAAGKSTTGEFFTNLSLQAKGVMFSSATYAKRPDNFSLYATRTSMRDLGSLSYIQSVISTGKDRLTEFISSGLAEQGELIRRERSFQNAKIISEGIGIKNIRAVYNEYDSAVTGFRSVAKFIRSKQFKDAVKKAIDDTAIANNIRLAPEFDKDEHENKENYNIRYADQYKAAESFGGVGKNHFHFIEQLLFSLKAQGVAEIALRELNHNNVAPEGEVIVRAVSSQTGDYIKGACKPIIAVKNTLESIFEKVGIIENVEFDNADFSLYFKYLLTSIIKSNITYKKIVENDDDEPIIIKDFEITLDGVLKDVYDSLKEFLESIRLNIPISPLDTLIDVVQSEKSAPSDPFRKGKYYICREISGRKTRLTKIGEKYMLIKNDVVEQNNASAFQKFNSGEVDFLIINQSGSTGASAHSSNKFKDQRPRSMLIHQIELNIQTEIQKRGRINRTGQVYYPKYVYVTSPIPSEVRRLVMFSKKMATLDAITSANRKNSEALSNIVQEVEAMENVEGGNQKESVQIVDFINKYGWTVAEPVVNEIAANNEDFRQFLQNEMGAWFNDKADDEKKLEILLRVMEIQNTDIQKQFFLQVTRGYIALVETLIESDEYDLDTQYRKFDAVTNLRYELATSKGETIFKQGVYVEDAWVVADDKRMTKEELEEKIYKGLDNGTLTERQKIQQIVAEIERSMANSVASKTLTFWEGKRSRIEAVKEDEKEALMQLLNDELKAKVIDWEFEYQKAAIYVNNKAIRGNYMLPDINAQQGGQNVMSFSLGKLVRVFFSNKPNDRSYYYPSEINIEFAYLTGLTTRATLNYTPSNLANLEAITSIKDVRDNEMLDNWQLPKSKNRVRARFLSGNLFKAFSIAQDYIEYWNNIAPQRERLRARKDFVRFSIFKSSAIRYAIRLYSDFPNVGTLKNKILPRYVGIGDDGFIETQISPSTRNTIEVSVKGDPVLLITIIDGYWNVYLLESKGKKDLKNPAFVDDWQSKSGNENNWGQVAFKYTKDGAKRGSTYSGYRVRIGSEYSNFREREEIVQLYKFLGSIFKTLQRVSVPPEELEVVNPQDLFEAQNEIFENLNNTVDFLYFGRNMDALKTLFDFIPLNPDSPPVNKGFYFEIKLSRTPDVSQLMAYQLVPKKITPTQVISSIYGNIAESSRVEFIRILKQLRESNAPDIEYYFKAFGKYAYRFAFEQSIFGSNLNDREKGQFIRLGYEEAEDKLLELAIERKDILPPVVFDITPKNIQIYLLRFNLLLNLNS